MAIIHRNISYGGMKTDFLSKVYTRKYKQDNCLKFRKLMKKEIKQNDYDIEFYNSDKIFKIKDIKTHLRLAKAEKIHCLQNNIT